MHSSDAPLVELLSAAGIILEHDEPFWYAADARTAEPLAQGSEARQVARDALIALRQRLDQAEAAPRSRALGAADGGS
jgi:hypothetical protein